MDADFQTLCNKVQQQKIKGFLAESEAKCLFDYAKSVAAMGPVLEVGSYCGLSTLFIASAIKQNNQFCFALDHHRGSEEHQPGEEYHDPDLFDHSLNMFDSFSVFRNNIDRFDLTQTVIPIVADSQTVAKTWTTPLSFVFIDGGHSEAAALHDLLKWSQFVMQGGVLAVHDIYPDPSTGGQAPLVALRALLQQGQFKPERKVGSLVVLRRTQ